MRYLDIKERKFNIVKDVQSKGFVNSCKVAYHLLRISEKGFVNSFFKERKFNIVKDVQSKGFVNSCKVAYHLLRISEKGSKRLKK